jgi:outer membrane protein TolC
LTATAQTASGFAAVGPTIDASTNFSNLNFPVGDNRANGLTVPLASDGSLDVIYVARAGSTAQLLLDVTGYYMGAA